MAAATASAPALSVATTVEEKLELITRNLQEVMGNDSVETMKKALAAGKDLKVYWGTATTGAPHIGYFVPMSKIADFLRAGLHVTILFADLHAYLDNMKSSWELLTHRTSYYEHVIKAMLQSIGVPIEKLTFTRGTSYQLSREYTLDVYKLTSLVTERNAKKAGAEVVKQVSSPLLSGLLYPLLQALDEQYLGVDIQFGGVDQRKIFTFAEENLPKIGYAKRIHLMNPMVPGLQGPKMSSSEKGSKIDLLESEESVNQKLRNAYCKEGEVADNGVLAFCKMVLFALNKDPKGLTFEREAKHGGNLVFKNYQELEDAFVKKKLFPLDLKNGVAKLINGLLAPIRSTFTDAKLVQLVKDAYPPNSEAFHQAAEPEPEDDDEDAKDVKDAKSAAPADSKAAPSAAAGKTAAKKEKTDGAAALDIRVGRIVEAKKHEKGDHLIRLKVDVGAEGVRDVTCGGGKSLSLDDLKGKLVPVVVNIKKTPGIVFVAQSADGKTVEIVEAVGAVGDRVLEKGAAALAEYTSQRDDWRKKLWETVSIGGKSELQFGGKSLVTAAGPVAAKTVVGGKLL